MVRITTKKRVTLQNVAEREVMRYQDNHALWHQHVHGTTLDSMQILKSIEMDAHPHTIDYSCRRTGKTAIKELYLLKYLATNCDQELGIVAPREAQSLVNLSYHLEAIRRSEILTNYIRTKSGRQQINDTTYQFMNRSIARAYGIMAQVDGGDLTCASLEEVDDMPKERLFNRFLLMLGASRRFGANEDSKNHPQIRITGVFKGADTLTDLINTGQYEVLPILDVYLGVEMGILNKEFMELMRTQLSPDEYIRQLLCKNITARNLIWETYIRRALQVGLEANLQLTQPLPGMRYKKRGLISFGYDAGGHGESQYASKHALVVVEQIGNFTCVVFAKTWLAGADDEIVKRDLLGFWRYFSPDYAYGDAYGIGLLTQLNDELYSSGLTDIDRRSINDGESTATTWTEWAFAPLRFEGMVKHSMAQALRALFHNGQAAIPYIDDQDVEKPDTSDVRLLVRQLGNMTAEPTQRAYASYRMVNTRIGDDLFDAMMAAVWALIVRGAAPVETLIYTRIQKRNDLLK